MEFGSRCKRGGEVVCKDWWWKNIKEVIWRSKQAIAQSAWRLHYAQSSVPSTRTSMVFSTFKVESFIII